MSRKFDPNFEQLVIHRVSRETVPDVCDVTNLSIRVQGRGYVVEWDHTTDSVSTVDPEIYAPIGSNPRSLSVMVQDIERINALAGFLSLTLGGFVE